MYIYNCLHTCQFVIIQKNWKILDFIQPPKESVQNGIAFSDWSMLEFPLRVLLCIHFLVLLDQPGSVYL